MEIWKPVKDYEGFYEVSNIGNVRSIPRVIISKNGVKKVFKEYILKTPQEDRNGYLKIVLNRTGYKNKWVHRLVAESFLEPVKGMNFVNHLDSNRKNNHVSNLEWTTMVENNWHSPSTKLSKHDVHFIRDCADSNQFSIKELSDIFPIKESHIRQIVNGKVWKHLPVLK